MTEKDQLWKDLKAQWAQLKRGSNATETEKGKAKERINEIQDKLGLERTKWDQPRQPGSHLTSSGSGSSGSGGDNVLIEKVLGTVLEMRREMNDQLLEVQQRLNKMGVPTPS